MGRKTKIKREKKEAMKKQNELINQYIEESVIQKAELTKLIEVLRKENEELRNQLPQSQIDLIEEVLAIEEDEERAARQEEELAEEDECSFPGFIKKFVTAQCCECCKNSISSLTITQIIEDMFEEEE
jgi:uncharacterized membrane-anchored protein YjiN (DUF445 family)